MEFNEIYENEYPSLSLAIATGNEKVFNKLVKLRKRLNVKDNRGRFPLHEAGEYNRVNFANVLLKYNKDLVNNRSYEGETPLFLSCKFHDNACMVKALVEYGADVNIGNNEGITPLHIACAQKHTTVVEELIDLGANVNARDMNEFTPLHTAVENNLNLVAFFVSRGADPSLRDSFGRTSLFLAVQYADLPVIKSLLDARINVNKSAFDGVTPLMMAAQRGILEHVDVLLGNGADPNVEANDNLMAIHLALGRSDHEPVVKRLLEVTDTATISDNIKKIPDYSLEFLALENNTLSYLRLLLDSGQKPETMFQPIRNTDYLRDNGVVSFNCCEVVKNAKFTTVSFVTYFLFKFYASPSVSSMLEQMLEHGCPAVVSDEKCYPPILAAVHLPSADAALRCINVLAEHGIDVDHSSAGNSCPDVLIGALLHSHHKVILRILQLTSFATLDDIASLAVGGLCSVDKIAPLVEILGGISPCVFKRFSAEVSSTRNAHELFTPCVCSLQALCRTVLRKHFHKACRNCSITDICQKLQIPKLLVSYLKYENCIFPAL